MISNSEFFVLQDPTYQHTPTKAKKSLAEKLSKTILDRLNSPNNRSIPGGGGPSSPNPIAASTSSNWIYPPAFYHPRLVPYQHHGTFIHPWEQRYYGDFVDYAYEYPVSSKPPAASNNAYCGCYDNLHGTVSRASRRTNGKCKHCHKSRQPLSVHQQSTPLLHTTQHLPPLTSPAQASTSNGTGNSSVSAESALKKLTTQVSQHQHPSADQPKKTKTTLFRDYLEFNGINRLNKKVVGGGHQIEDEWQSYWDDFSEDAIAAHDEEEVNDKDVAVDQDASSNFASHLKISEEKSLNVVQLKQESTRQGPLEDCPKKNLTTFAALNNKKVPEQDLVKQSSSGPEQPHEEDVVVPAAADNSVSPETVTETGSAVDNQKNHLVQPDSVTNELKEFVRQRYARRYRSKFPRHRKSNLLDEVILEEDEDALEAENLEIISEEPCSPVKSILKRNSLCTDSEVSDESSNKSDPELEPSSSSIDIPEDVFDQDAKMMMLKRHHQKRKKGVTFSPEPVKTPSIQVAKSATHVISEKAVAAESSEDELNGYDKVVVSQNLAEEILDEIYGKIEAYGDDDQKTQVYENSVVNENGAIEAPFHLHDPTSHQPKSLADEILDELYGRKADASVKHEKEILEDHSYEEIRATNKSVVVDLEQSPAITGKPLANAPQRRVFGPLRASISNSMNGIMTCNLFDVRY